MRVKVRKPGLNQPVSRSCRSASTGASSGCARAVPPAVGRAARRSRPGTARSHVHAPEQLVPRRFAGPAQPCTAGRRRLLAIGLDGREDARRVGTVVLGQQGEEGQTLRRRSWRRTARELAGQGGAGCLAPGRQQVAAEALGARSGAGRRAGLRTSSRPASAIDVHSWSSMPPIAPSRVGVGAPLRRANHRRRAGPHPPLPVAATIWLPPPWRACHGALRPAASAPRLALR